MRVFRMYSRKSASLTRIEPRPFPMRWHGKSPFQKFGGKSLYPSLVSKSGILFYLMVKNHPFQNGNKRIAITTLLMFLSQNKKWLQADTQEFYNFTVWI